MAGDSVDRRSSGSKNGISSEQAALETPVLFMIFNRPGPTRAVFETIRAARPRRLYVAADGPRPHVAEEPERCAEARRIATAVDWPCQLRTRFQEGNAGLAVQVSSALDWFFENEGEGIILEDDCIPDPTFFRYCAELLERYRDIAPVMHISGDNFQYGRVRGRGSYFFSKYPFIWGWATWRRAWKLYDFRDAPPHVQSSTWDAQWLRCLEKNKGVGIVPNVNLVSNVGFGEDSTHTKSIETFSVLPAKPMVFPMRHPETVEINVDADVLSYYVVFRRIRYIRLLGLYRMWDWVYRVLKAAKRRFVATWSTGRRSE